MLFLDNGLPSPETTETTEPTSLGADQSSRSCAAADAAFSLAVVVVSLRKMHTMEVGDTQITTTKIAKNIHQNSGNFSWSGNATNHWLVCYFIFF